MSFLAVTPDVDFSAPKTCFCNDLATLKTNFTLKKTADHSGAILYKIDTKSTTASAETVLDLEACVKIAANIRVVQDKEWSSLSVDEQSLCQLKSFQLFSRTIKGQECLASKKNRIMEKAIRLSKGLHGYFNESILIKQSYWPEVLLPNHPYGADIADYYDSWKISKTHLNFEDFMALKPDHLKPASGVGYLNEAERKLFEIKIRDGKIFNSSGPIDTSKIPSDKKEASAIYVISCDLKMYVGPYLVGKFHHSSFLAGAPVLGAGEIQTAPDGTILSISSKSGHYKPSNEQIHSLSNFLKGLGIDVSRIPFTEYTGTGSIKNHASIPDFEKTSPLLDPTKCLRIRADSLGAGIDAFDIGSPSPLLTKSPPLLIPSPYAGASKKATEEISSPIKLLKTPTIQAQIKAPFAESPAKKC